MAVCFLASNSASETAVAAADWLAAEGKAGNSDAASYQMDGASLASKLLPCFSPAQSAHF